MFLQPATSAAPASAHTSLRPAQARRRSFWLSLVLALLLLQQLGLVHRYLHGAPAQVSASWQADAAPLEVDGGVLAHDRSLCLVLDQLCMADAVPALPLVLPPALSAGTAYALPLWAFVARWSAPFQARGPPVFL